MTRVTMLRDGADAHEATLMDRWRAARDAGTAFPAEVWRELAR